MKIAVSSASKGEKTIFKFKAALCHSPQARISRRGQPSKVIATRFIQYKTKANNYF